MSLSWQIVCRVRPKRTLKASSRAKILPLSGPVFATRKLAMDAFRCQGARCGPQPFSMLILTQLTGNWQRTSPRLPRQALERYAASSRDTAGVRQGEVPPTPWRNLFRSASNCSYAGYDVPKRGSAKKWGTPPLSFLMLRKIELLDLLIKVSLFHARFRPGVAKHFTTRRAILLSPLSEKACDKGFFALVVSASVSCRLLRKSANAPAARPPRRNYPRPGAGRPPRVRVVYRPPFLRVPRQAASCARARTAPLPRWTRACRRGRWGVDGRMRRLPPR